MKKFFSILSLFCCLSISLMAVPAYRGLLTKTQPDGTTINYYLHGDEYFNFYSSEDGYLIVLNENGVFEYAEFNEQNQIIPVGIKVSDISKRNNKEKKYLKDAITLEDLRVELTNVAKISRAKAQQRVKEGNAPIKRYPLEGTPTSLVILVNFKDVSFVTPKENFVNLLNEKGYSDNGATGSAKDFFEASSNGVFHPDFVVVGPYTLPENMDYYGTDYGTGAYRNERYASQMVIDACKAADADVNFKDYDTDGDGNIDNVFVYYAGHNQAEGGPATSVWPHRSQIISKNNFDGVMLKDYACTSELKSDEGSVMCGIGTFCHEFGHVLGLPDFYVTDYGHKAPTLGSWDAMDEGPYNNGGKTPPSYSSYERFYLGWLKPTILEPGGEFELEPLLTSNTAYIIAKETPNLNGKHPSPSEFFMLENRQKNGWDSVGLRGHGLLITHIDWEDNKWRNNVVNNDSLDMGVQIVCASRTTKSPSYNTFPGSDNIRTCQLTMKDGYKFEEVISSIFEKDGKISFIYGESPTTPYVSFTGDNFQSFITDYGTPLIKTVNFKGHHLSSDVLFKLKVGTNYRIRKQGDEDFSRSVDIAVNPDSTIDCVLEFKFEPNRITNVDDYLIDVLSIEADNYVVQYDIQGQSKKGVNVKKPVVYEAKNITENSFTAHWQGQPKATCYYLSVYSKENAVSFETEEFGTFSDKEKPEGWEANFSTTSPLYKSTPPYSVYFKDIQDTLWSKEYFSAVSKVSLWIHSNNTIGTFFVDGLVNGEWTNLCTKEINTSVKRQTITFDLGGKICYKFRMYYEASSVSAGGICVDDFQVEYNQKPVFIHENLEVFDTLWAIGGLTNDRYYYYRLKASDKNIDLAVDKNEQISPYSDEIKVNLLGYVNVDNLSKDITELYIEYVGAQQVLVDLGEEPTASSSVYIYSIDGRLVQTIVPTQQRFEINGLIPNNMYIIKYSTNSDINQINKIGKLIY